MYIVPRKQEKKGSTLQRVKLAAEEVGLLTIASIILIAPCVALCLVMGQIWPLYLVSGSQTIGAIIGAINYGSDNESIDSCVPRVEPKYPKDDDSSDWKKAA
jgi:hypothetical protein